MREMIADQRWHPLVETEAFYSLEEYVLGLIHRKAYEQAAEMARARDVLDWGCNQGYGMEILRGKASRVCGLDVAPAAIQAATTRLPDLADDIRLYDGIHVPFDFCTFDMVTSFQVIEHVADYETYLSHIRDVLRPGGCALFTTPNAIIRLDPGMNPWNKFHVREFTARQLRDLLARWFTEVHILTLRATPEIESIEKTRCEMARTGARKHRLVGNVRRFGSAILRRTRVRATQERTPLAAHILSRFSVSDLSYNSSDLDAGLDLLGIAWK